MRQIGVAERRARLGLRHHLARRSGREVTQLAGELCGLHATDPVTVYLSARARLSGFQPADLETALYQQRTAIRMMGMRRTMFVVPTVFAPVVHQACTTKIAQANGKRLAKLIEVNGVTENGARWLAEVEGKVLAHLELHGEGLAGELSAAVPELKSKVTVSPGKSYGGEGAVTNRVLTHLAMAGRIVRGKPSGGWTSTRYRWAALSEWTAEDLERLPAEQAEADLARAWLRAFGPATADDLMWWAGWTGRQTQRALTAVGAAEVDLDGRVGWILPDDDDPCPPPDPWVALLPSLDPTAMGWTERDFYLGEHRAYLFDRSGNIGPTVWSDGRVVGGWAQRADGEIRFKLLEDTGTETRDQVESAAHELATWLGDTRFNPRFPTPLERDLKL
ncbi:MAG: winged helix DNA-binding domain-containing protein [Streptosporangiaceae bacterium]